MQSIAWQSVRKNGGFGRPSINHYTFDDKTTLCGKKIPKAQKVFHPTNTCAKCSERKEIVDASFKNSDDKVDSFKQLVEECGGIYELENDMYKATWTDSTKLYYAYGRLVSRSMSGDWINLTDGKLYYKPAGV